MVFELMVAEEEEKRPRNFVLIDLLHSPDKQWRDSPRRVLFVNAKSQRSMGQIGDRAATLQESTYDPWFSGRRLLSNNIR